MCICVCMSLYIFVICVQEPLEVRREIGSLELELWMVVSCLSVLCRICRSSYTTSHLSSPLC